MRKIVFLDFDGVLSKGFNKKFEKVGMFCQWLREHPDVEVVISSAWRIDRTLEQLRRFFEADVQHQIISSTPQRLSDYEIHQRQREIEQWISENIHEPLTFVAIDDAPELFLPNWPHIIYTETFDGLKFQHLQELTKRFSNDSNT